MLNLCLIRYERYPVSRSLCKLYNLLLFYLYSFFHKRHPQSYLVFVFEYLLQVIPFLRLNNGGRLIFNLQSRSWPSPRICKTYTGPPQHQGSRSLFLSNHYLPYSISFSLNLLRLSRHNQLHWGLLNPLPLNRPYIKVSLNLLFRK